jgi:hypothetical protein
MDTQRKYGKGRGKGRGNDHKRGKFEEKSLLERFLSQRYQDQPIGSLLECITRKCQFRLKRGMGYICTMKLPSLHPDQEFQGRKCKTKREAENSAAAECLRFVVDEAELAAASSTDWKSHLNIFLMQQLNQSEIAKKDNVIYDVKELGEGSVVLYLARLTLPTLLPGLEIYGELTRSKRQAEQSVAQKLITDVDCMEEIVRACEAINSLDGGAEAARTKANKIRRWQKYKSIQLLRDIKNRHIALRKSAIVQGRKRAPPPVPAEAQARYKFLPPHVLWEDTVVRGCQPNSTQLILYSSALQRNLLLVLPIGVDRSLITSMVVRRMLFCLRNCPASFSPVPLRRFAVLLCATADQVSRYGNQVSAASALRVYCVSTHQELSALCGKVTSAAFDVLVITGDLFLVHLQLTACSANPASHVHMPDICCLVLLDCIHLAFAARILLLARSCPVKPRLLAFTDNIAPTVDMDAEVNAALLLVQQLHAIQWMLLGARVLIPVQPPPAADICSVCPERVEPPRTTASSLANMYHAEQQQAADADAETDALPTTEHPAAAIVNPATAAALLQALNDYGSSSDSDLDGDGEAERGGDGACDGGEHDQVCPAADSVGEGEDSAERAEDLDGVVAAMLLEMVDQVVQKESLLELAEDGVPKQLLLTALLAEQLVDPDLSSAAPAYVVAADAHGALSLEEHLRARFHAAKCAAIVSRFEYGTLGTGGKQVPSFVFVPRTEAREPGGEEQRSAFAVPFSALPPPPPPVPPCSLLAPYPLPVDAWEEEGTIELDDLDGADAAAASEDGSISIDDVVLADPDEAGEDDATAVEAHQNGAEPKLVAKESIGAMEEVAGAENTHSEHNRASSPQVVSAVVFPVFPAETTDSAGREILVITTGALAEAGQLLRPSLTILLSGDPSFLVTVQTLCGCKRGDGDAGRYFAITTQTEEAREDARLRLHALARKILET